MYGNETTPPIHAGRYKALSPRPLGSGSGKPTNSYPRQLRDGEPTDTSTASEWDFGFDLSIDDEADPDSGDGSLDIIDE